MLISVSIFLRVLLKYSMIRFHSESTKSTLANCANLFVKLWFSSQNLPSVQLIRITMVRFRRLHCFHNDVTPQYLHLWYRTWLIASWVHIYDSAYLHLSSCSKNLAWVNSPKIFQHFPLPPSFFVTGCSFWTSIRKTLTTKLFGKTYIRMLSSSVGSTSDLQGESSKNIMKC